jgi:serine/threonine protein kinase
MSKKMKRGNIKGLFDEIIKKKNLNEKEALIIFQQLIDTMIYLHNMNICHRDIKPENILFDKNNEIKLIDFGFSFCYGNQNLKINDDFGTPSYACPEMHKGEKYNPELPDVWIL